MKRYITHINLGDVYTKDLAHVLDMLRERASWVEYSPVDHVATVIYETGPDGGAEDLWDLRDVLHEVEANLSSYTPSFHVEKPVEVPVP